ncbi:MAG: nucleotide exchange factor GrpE [Christensenellales bacterium]|jgi:molecular chaperone GrpE
MQSSKEKPEVNDAANETTTETDNAGAVVTLAEHEEALKQRDEYLAAAQRVQADFDNYRRRNNSVRAEACAQGKEEAVIAVLPVLDNLERALKGGESHEGLALIVKQFVDVLKSLGAEEIPADGCKFDPVYHDALMQMPPCEGKECGDVHTVILKGYTMDGKILRHAKVQVVGE